jgi:Bacterial Ig domain
MKQSFPRSRATLSSGLSRLKARRRLTLLVICLAAAAILLAFAVSAKKQPNSGTSVAPPPQSQNKGVKPEAVNITATLADDIALANTKNPGDTITYRAVITNSGSTDAAGVVYNDTLDANTTQTGGVTISPLAINDGTYQSIGNMTLTSANLGVDCAANALRSVTCNDTLNGATLVGFGATQGTANGTVANGTNTVTTSNGGTVKLNTDGTFVFDPGAGFEGSDTFWYTLSNTSVTPNLTDNAQVTINVGGANGMVWFISSAGGGTGRQANPFTLAAFNTANTGVGSNPADNDTVFLFEGAHVGPVTLRTGQKFIGQDATTSVPNLGGPALPSNGGSTGGNAYPTQNPSGTTVSITSAGVGITLGSGNNLAGFTVGNSTTAITGTAVGTFKVREVVINTSGQGFIISTSGAASQDAIFPGFTSTTTTGGTNGVSLTGLTGTLQLGSGALSGATGTTFNVSGGTATITYSGNITQGTAGQAMISISGHSAGTITFDGSLSATNGTGLQFNNADGTYTFNGSDTLNGGDAGIDIVNGCAGTFSFSSNTAITSPTGMAYNEDTSTANVTYNGTITQNNANNAVNINVKTGGTTAFNKASGPQITASTTTANAIDLTNTGGIVNFTGGLSLTTTSGVGFNASGSGATISATQNNGTIVNTISSTTGTGLSVVNTTIGASGLTFRSISSNGGTNGIVLSATGATAGLTVSGNGGTCTSIATCTGGTIQNKTVGVSLNNTTSFSVDRMFISATGNSGINGVLVNNFSFTNGKIDNSGTALGAGDSNIAFNTGEFSGNTGVNKNISGTLTITGNTLTNAYYSGLDVYQFDGTISNANVSSNTLTSSTSTSTSKSTAILLECLGSASTVSSISKGTINSNVITNFPSNAGIFIAGGNATSTGAPAGTYGTDATTNIIAINSNTITGQSAAVGLGTQGITVTLNGRGTGFFSANSNSITNVLGNGIQPSAFGLTTLNMFVIGNTINAHNKFASQGIGAGTGNTFANTDTPTLNIKIGDGTVSGVNNISNTDGNGILIVARSATGHVNARVLKNTVAAPIDSPPSGTSYGIRLDAGNAASGSAGDTVCLDISGNTTAGDNDGAGTIASGIGLRRNKLNNPAGAPAGIFGIVGMAATTTPGVENYVNGLNPGSASGSFGVGGTTLISATDGFSNCSEPAVLAELSPEMKANRHEYLARATFDELFVSTDEIATRNQARATRQAPQAIGNSGDGVEQTHEVINALTNVGSNASPATFARLKQVMHPVAAFAADVSFLTNKIDDVLTPTVMAEDKARSTAEVSPATEPNRVNSSRMTDDKPVTPLSGELVTVNIGALPAGKSITLVYQATVNTPPLVRSVQTQGNVTYTGGPGGGINTDDLELPGAPLDPTKTNLNVTSTWTGATSTDWNTATNWNPNTYAPGVSNPAVNDVVIPSGALPNEPAISASDISVFSLNIANGRTLTITSPRTLTINGAAAGSDLTLDGIIDGGALNFVGAGPHLITHAVSMGSISSTNTMTLLSGAVVTLNNAAGNDLQMGSLVVKSGASMTITGRTLSLNGAGGLNVAGTFTPAVRGDGESGPPTKNPGGGIEVVGSTVVYNGSSAQTGAGITYFGLTINNSAGVTLDNNATVNGTLALTSGDLHMGAPDQFTLTQPNNTASTGTGDVTGSVMRTGAPLPAATALTFGNPDCRITFTTSSLTQMTVKLVKAAPTDGNTGGTNTGFPSAILRTYIITPGNTGTFTSPTLRLHYNDPADLNSNPEANLKFWRFRSSAPAGWQKQTTSTVNVASNYVEQTAVSGFSPWTMADGSGPTAANGNVSGRIVDANGNPVEGAGVRMSGTQNRLTVTDANGNYNFADVETNGFYTVVPTRANYSFSPQQRSFSQLGLHTDAAFTAASNGDTQNPLDRSEYFVRQQYVDFLSREPDEAGFNFWVNNIESCGADAQCREVKRIDTSAAFFLSIEFQQTGYLVYRTYESAYGDIANTPVPMRLGEFQPDTRAIGNGVIVAQGDWEQTLETNKQAFMTMFVGRSRFISAYPTTMTPTEFVDKLFANAGVVPSGGDRDAAVSEFGSASTSSDAAARARALRLVAENSALTQKESAPAFVLMEYFGYLRRDANSTPDTNFDGYNFWLGKLETFKGNYQQAELVKAFLSSTEYRGRFPR